MTEKPRNLRISEAAEELNVSDSSVRRWLADGRLKGWKEGRVVRVKKESIERFVKTHPYEVAVLNRRRPGAYRWWYRS